MSEPPRTPQPSRSGSQLPLGLPPVFSQVPPHVMQQLLAAVVHYSGNGTTGGAVTPVHGVAGMGPGSQIVDPALLNIGQQLFQSNPAPTSLGSNGQTPSHTPMRGIPSESDIPGSSNKRMREEEDDNGSEGDDEGEGEKMLCRGRSRKPRSSGTPKMHLCKVATENLTARQRLVRSKLQVSAVMVLRSECLSQY